MDLACARLSLLRGRPILDDDRQRRGRLSEERCLALIQHLLHRQIRFDGAPRGSVDRTPFRAHLDPVRPHLPHALGACLLTVLFVRLPRVRVVAEPTFAPDPEGDLLVGGRPRRSEWCTASLMLQDGVERRETPVHVSHDQHHRLRLRTWADGRRFCGICLNYCTDNLASDSSI